MKQPKNIAPLLLLLLWAVLLCFSVSYTSTQLLLASSAAATASEEHVSEEPTSPPAWTEPTPQPASAVSYDTGTPLLLQSYHIGFSFPYRCVVKPARSIPGFASLAYLFPILPNAP